MPKVRNRLATRDREVLRNYFGVSRGNKTDALRRAGYKHPNNYSTFWAKPAVAAELTRREAEIKERYDVSYERVIEELATLAYSHPLDFMSIDNDGNFYFDVSETDSRAMGALAEVSVAEFRETDKEGNVIVKRRVKVKPYDKRQALVDLLKLTGQSREKIDVTGQVDLIHRIEAARRRVPSAGLHKNHRDHPEHVEDKGDGDDC